MIVGFSGGATCKADVKLLRATPDATGAWTVSLGALSGVALCVTAEELADVRDGLSAVLAQIEEYGNAVE